MAKNAKRHALPKKLPAGVTLEKMTTKGGDTFYAPQVIGNAEGVSAAMLLYGENGAESIASIINSFFANACQRDVNKYRKANDQAGVDNATAESQKQIPFAPKVRTEEEKLQSAVAAQIKSLPADKLAALLAQIQK